VATGTPGCCCLKVPIALIQGVSEVVKVFALALK